MRTNIARWFAIAILVSLTACGGGGGGGGDSAPVPIQSDPAMVATVLDALVAFNPDAALQEFYELTGNVSSDTAIKSFLDALQAGGDMSSVLSTMLATGQVFGFESLILPMTAISNPCGSQQPTVVWFVNGIGVTPWGAIINLREVKKVVAEANIGVNPDSVHLFYNKSGIAEGILEDEFCNLFFGANGSEDSSCGTESSWAETYALFRCSGADLGESIAQWANQWLPFVPSADAQEVEEFRALIQQDIDSGKKVIIMAHSQGNFFAQRAVEGLSVGDRRAVAVVALATPANYGGSTSYGYFDYLTLQNDVIDRTPLGLEANGTNELTQGGGEFEIHSLKCSYLGQTTSRNRVKQMLQSASNTVLNSNAPGARGFLEITAKWFEPGNVDLFVGEKDFTNDDSAEVDQNFPNGMPGHVFGYLDHSEQVGPGFEHYVVCSRSDLREACFEIRLFPFGIPEGSQVHVTIKAGTRVWQFIEFYEGNSIIVTHLNYRNGVFALTNDCVPPSVFDETGGN